MSVDEDDTERTAVHTYVPAYQRDIWDEHADELDMSRSEFVRSMVQAGRSGFDPRGSASETGENVDGDPTGEDSPDQNGLEDEILSHLDDGPRSWDDLFEAVAGDIETRLEETLASLQDENRVQYSGREGGYVRTE